jgi:hypothetical protein
MRRVFEFEFELNQVHLPLIPRNYKMKHRRLHIMAAVKTRGVTETVTRAHLGVRGRQLGMWGASKDSNQEN